MWDTGFRYTCRRLHFPNPDLERAVTEVRFQEMNQTTWFVGSKQLVYQAILPYSIESFVHAEKGGPGQIFPPKPSFDLLDHYDDL